MSDDAPRKRSFLGHALIALTMLTVLAYAVLQLWWIIPALARIVGLG